MCNVRLTGEDLADLLRGELAAKRGDAALDLVRRGRKVVSDVRRRGHRRHALGHGPAGKRDRGGEIRDAVVEPREDVRVEVDHRACGSRRA